MAFVCRECGRRFGDPGFCTEDGGALYDNTFCPLGGEKLGSYRIARLIGQGGMGEVYLGIHPEIGSRVAIKLLAIDAARSPNVVERFFAEARAVNVIRHEGIVSVLDLARSPDGRPYIVMEFLDGAPLAQVLTDHRPVPLGAFLQIAAWVLGALGAAHAHGITHRDLKPDNVFVTSLGHVKLLDFGIAKLKPELGGVSEATRTGALLGTPFYMSPEQARGAPVDHRSDLYSLGVILFEGVTGGRPFEASSLYELLRQQIEVTPPLVGTLRPDAPPALEQLIARALEKDPAHRFQTAEEMAYALQQVLPFVPKESFSTLTGRPSPHAALLPQALIGSTTSAAGYAATVPERGVSPATPSAAGSRVLVTALWVGGASLLTAIVVGVLGVAALFVFGDRDTITIVDTGPARPTSDNASAPAKSGVLDLRRFDAVAYLPQATALARDKMADAELTSIILDSPNREGLLDLADEGTITYAFRSPKASTEAAGGCVVWVSVSESGPNVSVPPLGSCMGGTIRPPRCSVAQILRRTGIAPKGASLTYGAGGWTVLDAEADLPKLVADDC